MMVPPEELEAALRADLRFAHFETGRERFSVAPHMELIVTWVRIIAARPRQRTISAKVAGTPAALSQLSTIASR